MLTLHVLDDDTRAALARLMGAVRHPRPLLLAGTIAGRRLLQRHFTARDRTPNALGGRHTHFWREVRDSTQLGPVTDREGIIAICGVRSVSGRCDRPD
ncbi:MAG: hypothetical protein IPM17_07995 [Verrucomicrobia bacterium]|jgi:hypothetical protein|nr:hypothetical protein [Verrucomicrobiota bacterium]